MLLLHVHRLLFRYLFIGGDAVRELLSSCIRQHCSLVCRMISYPILPICCGNYIHYLLPRECIIAQAKSPWGPFTLHENAQTFSSICEIFSDQHFNSACLRTSIWDLSLIVICDILMCIHYTHTYTLEGKLWNWERWSLLSLFRQIHLRGLLQSQIRMVQGYSNLKSAWYRAAAVSLP